MSMSAVVASPVSLYSQTINSIDLKPNTLITNSTYYNISEELGGLYVPFNNGTIQSNSTIYVNYSIISAITIFDRYYMPQVQINTTIDGVTLYINGSFPSNFIIVNYTPGSNYAYEYSPGKPIHIVSGSSFEFVVTNMKYSKTTLSFNYIFDGIDISYYYTVVIN
ncbi:TVG1020030 [Thermoplasma volcanium GSS1]|uniref:TVG1020030 protein n=2 Tax=Thermoplasma volcanium TaxID=50339 RepID=Q97A12_THEVO|nr:TVG1020030 [Thermoplasma volcanium GSS1]